MVAAFNRWQLAEAASWFAAPCPDHLMDALVHETSLAHAALVAIVPTSADDLLLKIYPSLLEEYEPSANPLALAPAVDWTEAARATVTRLMSDLVAISPPIAAAVKGCEA